MYMERLLANRNHVVSIGNVIKDAFVFVDRFAELVKKQNGTLCSEFDGPMLRFKLTQYQSNECRFARTIRSNDADSVTAENRSGETRNDGRLGKGERDVCEVGDNTSTVRAV